MFELSFLALFAVIYNAADAFHDSDVKRSVLIFNKDEKFLRRWHKTDAGIKSFVLFTVATLVSFVCGWKGGLLMISSLILTAFGLTIRWLIFPIFYNLLDGNDATGWNFIGKTATLDRLARKYIKAELLPLLQTGLIIIFAFLFLTSKYFFYGSLH